MKLKMKKLKLFEEYTGGIENENLPKSNIDKNTDGNNSTHIPHYEGTYTSSLGIPHFEGAQGTGMIFNTIKYSNYLSERLNESINYSEYLANALNDRINGKQGQPPGKAMVYDTNEDLYNTFYSSDPAPKMTCAKTVDNIDYNTKVSKEILDKNEYAVKGFYKGQMVFVTDPRFLDNIFKDKFNNLDELNLRIRKLQEIYYKQHKISEFILYLDNYRNCITAKCKFNDLEGEYVVFDDMNVSYISNDNKETRKFRSLVEEYLAYILKYWEQIEIQNKFIEKGFKNYNVYDTKKLVEKLSKLKETKKPEPESGIDLDYKTAMEKREEKVKSLVEKQYKEDTGYLLVTEELERIVDIRKTIMDFIIKIFNIFKPIKKQKIDPVENHQKFLDNLKRNKEFDENVSTFLENLSKKEKIMNMLNE